MRVQITFRSGAQVVVDVAGMEVAHDGPAKQITALRWRNPDAGNLLLGVVPADVVAVVAVEVPAPEPPHRYIHGPNHPVAEHPPHPGMTCEQYHHKQNERETG